MADITLTTEERHEIGNKLGEIVKLVIDVIALVERVQPADVFQEIVERYMAETVIQSANEPESP